MGDDDMELDAMSPDTVRGAMAGGLRGERAMRMGGFGAGGLPKHWGGAAARQQELDGRNFFENGEYRPFAIDTTQESYYAVVRNR